MRVVDRKTFLELPEGTVYCKGEEWSFDGLTFKFETCGTNDWWSMDPAWVDGKDPIECVDRLEEMKNDGASYPMQISIGRDGCFDKDAMFLVFEREDLLKLRDLIDKGISASEHTHHDHLPAATS